MVELESILDAPREGLDTSVWKESGGKFVLTDDAERKIRVLVEYVRERFGLNGVSARITGSITSNQYQDDSDIDVHISFDGLDEENSDDFNRLLRADFDENFKDMHADCAKIADHPLEVYFQANPFQDLMSVGCYDFMNRTWLVGPDLKPMGYDPYSEFFSDDMEYVKDVVKDIRNVILECYETATVILGSTDEGFREEQFRILKERILKGTGIFQAAKQCRKVYSSPRSAEDAARKRESRKWKIADSSFKLMDRFGYLKILKNLSRIGENLENLDMDDVATLVLEAVTEKIRKENVDESLSGLGKFLAVASLLSLPGVVPSQALAKDLAMVSKAEFKMGSPAVQKSIRNVQVDKGTYGGYSAADVINMVARTIYVEGHAEGTDGRKAIASVIMNRAGNDRNNLPAVVKEKGAFSCWNKMTDSDWNNFIYKIPTSGALGIVGNPSNKRIWDECVGYAKQIFDGKFKSTIGNRNSYLNPEKANAKAKTTWGAKMDQKIKNHKFGYLKEHDPKYVVPGTTIPKTGGKGDKSKENSTYVIKQGDTLGAIAKKLGLSVDELLKKNPEITNPDKISVGQKLNA